MKACNPLFSQPFAQMRSRKYFPNRLWPISHEKKAASYYGLKTIELNENGAENSENLKVGIKTSVRFVNRLAPSI